MKVPKLFFKALLFLYSLTLWGQSKNFDTGTLHLRNGDSIVGYAKLLWHSNDIIFKQKIKGKRRTYTYRDAKYI